MEDGGPGTSVLDDMDYDDCATDLESGEDLEQNTEDMLRARNQDRRSRMYLTKKSVIRNLHRYLGHPAVDRMWSFLQTARQDRDGHQWPQQRQEAAE